MSVTSCFSMIEADLHQRILRYRPPAVECQSSIQQSFRQPMTHVCGGRHAGSVTVLRRLDVQKKFMYNPSTAYNVIVDEDRAGCEKLKDCDPKFQLGIVTYVCCCADGTLLNVVTVQSTTCRRSAGDRSAVRVLCAASDIARTEEFGAVDVESMEQRSAVPVVLNAESGRMFFFLEHQRNERFCVLRSMAYDCFCLAVDRSSSEENGPRLCLKRVDNLSTVPLSEFEFQLFKCC